MRTTLKRIAVAQAALGLVVAGLGMGGPARAGVGASQYCNDSSLGTGDDVPIAGGTDSIVPNTPFTVGVEFNTASGGPHLALCFSTSGYGDGSPEVIGQNIAVDILSPGQYSNPTGNTVNVNCIPDNNTQGVFFDCDFALRPVALSMGGTSGGQALLFEIPFRVCLGTCVGATIEDTGIVVGTLTAGTGGVTLTSLKVWVAGTPIGFGP